MNGSGFCGLWVQLYSGTVVSCSNDEVSSTVALLLVLLPPLNPRDRFHDNRITGHSAANYYLRQSVQGDEEINS